MSSRLGEIPLNKLTSLDMQQFYKDLLENGRIREDTKVKKPGLSSTTVHGIHVMLKSALKRAVQERLIPFNPAEFLYPAQDHETGTAGDPVGAVSVLFDSRRTARCPADVLSGAGYGLRKGKSRRCSGRITTRRRRRFM